MDRGAWRGQSPWGHKELDPTENLTHTPTLLPLDPELCDLGDSRDFLLSCVHTETMPASPVPWRHPQRAPGALMAHYMHVEE